MIHRQFIFTFPITLFCLFVILGCGAVQKNTSPPSPNPTYTKLKVVGNLIQTTAGETISLRGLGLTNGCYEKTFNKTKYGLTNEDYAQIKSSGANSVRFYMQYYWVTGDQKETFLTYLDQQIGLAANNKLYVILNLHYFGESDTIKNSVDDGFYRGNTKYDLKGFWKTLSDRYKDEPAVAAYDLINETNCNDNYKETDLYKTYETLIELIRANNDDHIIIVSDPVQKFNAPDASYHDIKNEAFKKLTDNNIIYQFHWYEPFNFSHQGALWVNPVPHLGITYPATKYEFDENNNWGYAGGFYRNPYWSKTQDNKWQEYEGNWVDFTTSADAQNGHTKENFANGNYVFKIDLSANKLNGIVWFDDIVLEKKIKQQNLSIPIIEKIYVPNSDFSLPSHYTGWDSISPADTTALWHFTSYNVTDLKSKWDKTENRTPIVKVIGASSGSLKVDGTSASWSNDSSANWSHYPHTTHRTFYPIEQGYLYRVKGFVRIKNNNTYSVSMGFSIFNKKTTTVYNKEWMAKKINNYYKNWANINNVPLYCGEFGVLNPSRIGGHRPYPKNAPSDQVKWVEDVANILNGSNISWAYHTYKSYSTNRLDQMGLYDSDEDTSITNVLKNKF